jgi:hypothetical protein
MVVTDYQATLITHFSMRYTEVVALSLWQTGATNELAAVHLLQLYSYCSCTLKKEYNSSIVYAKKKSTLGM